jgi:hypothetical protein
VKPLIVKLAWGTVIATVLTALALGAFLVWGLPELLPAGSAITIDGERIEINDMTPVHPGHWLMASMGALIAAVVIVIVVPLVVVLSIGVPLLLSAFGVAVGLLALALMMSPLILLVWWWWKEPKKKAAGATTIRP